MSDNDNDDDEDVPETDIVRVPRTDLNLRGFEGALIQAIGSCGLPTAGVLVEVGERQVVFANIGPLLDKLPHEQRPRSTYISKFLAATAAGLFDAALNYLWDETISELRRRVAAYDLDYFFDIAVTDPERRKRLLSADDLTKLEDSELIRAAHAMGLLSEIGFKHLDFIRFMRNWASAAHPNQNELTGLKLLGWLESCISEVMTLPLSNVVVEIKRLLANIKQNAITERDARKIAAFFTELTQEQVNNLASGLFGIYTQTDTTPPVQENITLLAPHLWDRVDIPTRQRLGVKYAQFIANNEQEQQLRAKQFLEAVGGMPYVPEELRAAAIATAVEDLLTAHRGINNFYSEPALARHLREQVGEAGTVPKSIVRAFVLGLVEVFVTNGNGVAWNAEPVYRAMLGALDASQALQAVLAFMEPTIASRLQFELCRKKYEELLALMKPKLTAPAALELVKAIEKYSGPLDKMRSDSRIKAKLAPLQTILGLSTEAR